MSRSLVQASDELQEISVDEFMRGNVAREGSTADHDYEGGFGDDDDLSDQTPDAVLGCHSWISSGVVFIDDGAFVERIGSLHRKADNDNYDAKVKAA